MKLKTLFLSLTLIVATRHHAYADRPIPLRNRSPFMVEFTVPTHEITSPEEFAHVTTTKTILAPQGCTYNSTIITIPDAVHFFWINLPPQLLCPTGKGYEKVNVSQFGIKDVDPLYDLFVSVDTSYITWIAVFCCYGFVSLPELVASIRRVPLIDPPGSEDDDPVFLCIPIYSPFPGTRRDDVSREVETFINYVRSLTQPR